ncbi:MAG: zinc-ribbon domain-containing protein [Armatimonadota bacterium]
MYCPYCGKELADDVSFCRYCGSKIPDIRVEEGEEAEPPTEKEPDTEPATEAAREPEAPRSPQQEPEAGPPTEKEAEAETELPPPPPPPDREDAQAPTPKYEEPPAAPEPQGTSGLAIGALVCAFLIPPLGLILGVVAVGQLDRDRQTGGRNLAIAAIVVSVFMMFVALLAAILFPVFAGAREKARMSSCMSNQKQLMTGIIMYTQDYDERLPRLYTGPARYLEGRGKSTEIREQSNPWYKAIDPYTKNRMLFWCPSDGTCDKENPFPDGSYAINVFWGGHSLADVRSPAQSVFLIDAGGGEIDGNFDNGEAGGFVPGDGPGWDDVAWLHNDGANFGYIDGHCKWNKGPTGRAGRELFGPR